MSKTMTVKEGAKRSFGTTMGVSSIIAILVILVLIVFAALSLTTSKADMSLAQKTADAVSAYYTADTEAENIFVEAVAYGEAGDVDWQKFADEHSMGVEEVGDVSKPPSIKHLTFGVNIDGERVLEVKLLAYEDGAVYRASWRVVNHTDWTPEDDLHLINPPKK